MPKDFLERGLKCSDNHTTILIIIIQFSFGLDLIFKFTVLVHYILATSYLGAQIILTVKSLTWHKQLSY